VEKIAAVGTAAVDVAVDAAVDTVGVDMAGAPGIDDAAFDLLPVASASCA
jgi:hypothetical protein